MSSTRTDVHAPSNVVIEDYDFAFAYDSAPDAGSSRFRVQQINLLLAEGWRYGGVHPSGQCDHCGARLRYIAVLKHEPSHTLIQVGETCLDNRFESLSTAEFHALRKAAAAERKTNSKASKIERLVAEHPLLQHLVDFSAVVERNEFLSDISWKLSRYADLSDRQIDAAERAIEGGLRYLAKIEASREADRVAVAEGVKVVCPTGRTEVLGTVLSAQVRDTNFGTTIKITVLDERGFKVWSTCPAAIIDAVDVEIRNSTGTVYPSYDEEALALKGRTIRFTAALEPSSEDPLFGFAKRPTKAAIKGL